MTSELIPMAAVSDEHRENIHRYLTAIYLDKVELGRSPTEWTAWKFPGGYSPRIKPITREERIEIRRERELPTDELHWVLHALRDLTVLDGTGQRMLDLQKLRRQLAVVGVRTGLATDYQQEWA